MSDFLETLLKCFGDFTWRRFAAMMAMCVVGVTAFFVYERYTSSFRLSRLQKSAELLAKVQEIERQSTNYTAQLETARAALVSQTIEAIKTQPITLEFVPSQLTFSMSSVWKFLVGTIWFGLVALMELRKIRTEKGKRDFLMAISLALLAGIGALFTPDRWWPWFHLFIYPFIFFFCLFICLLPFAIFKARRIAFANRCIHNLKQICGAKVQWARENKKENTDVPTWADLSPYLSIRPACPNGGKYALGNVGERPSCQHNHLGHALP